MKRTLYIIGAVGAVLTVLGAVIKWAVVPPVVKTKIADVSI